ncbi:MAG TPA: CpsB/CapC family capsule biosynthesis tyrosine phosphatase [Pirellulaceae bacterium]|nr:CpsB/CapC family capsule biosynthesis tyrosine phosphatase [Pirellulaceae bacterium]
MTFKIGVILRFDPSFVDIHCHLLPDIDDGARSLQESLAMAEIAVADGIRTIIVTPHQNGSYAHNRGDAIRQRVVELQEQLEQHHIPLTVLPGADVRIEDGMIEGLRAGDVLTLGDLGRHVLLELPHELYFPLERVLDELATIDMVGVLSHPERNQGILKQPSLVELLVEYGCLMQITAGSLMGTFGRPCQEMSEWMLKRGLVQFIATDAHGPRSRRPLIRRAYEYTAELVGEDTANALCCANSAAVSAGDDVFPIQPRIKKIDIPSWFSWRKAG